MTKKKIVFLTSTRADFGKIKSLINVVDRSASFEAHIFATGMHLLPKYGVTVHEILKCGYTNIYLYNNEAVKKDMDVSLANTIYGFSSYIKELNPDLIIVHGDRPEALAGAIVGSFNNVRVAHIEGGELSGTIDGLIRHSITKLSHIHFVSNGDAKNRLLQMGEIKKSIFEIGSPEVDLMMSDRLPSLEEVKKHYGIEFTKYAIFIKHPVTTEIDKLGKNINISVNAIIESKLNYIVVTPNNDNGSDIILKEFRRFENLNSIKVFPSIKFESFLTLLKNAEFIIGNSSAGVREAPVYGVKSINIGRRQDLRNKTETILNVNEDYEKILFAINESINSRPKQTIQSNFGDGKSSEKFKKIINGDSIWKVKLQKLFEDRIKNLVV